MITTPIPTTTNIPTVRSRLLTKPHGYTMKLSLLSLLFAILGTTNAEHHMARKIEVRQNGNTNTPLIVTNQCAEVIYPGIVTQGGTGPSNQGFKLSPGDSQKQTVSADWQGRIWGRTNCSFNAQGTAQGGGAACATGDCGGTVTCRATVRQIDRSQSVIH